MGENLYETKQHLLRSKLHIAYFVNDYPHKREALQEAVKAIDTAIAVIGENDESESG